MARLDSSSSRRRRSSSVGLFEGGPTPIANLGTRNSHFGVSGVHWLVAAITTWLVMQTMQLMAAIMKAKRPVSLIVVASQDRQLLAGASSRLLLLGEQSKRTPASSVPASPSVRPSAWLGSASDG